MLSNLGSGCRATSTQRRCGITCRVVGLMKVAGIRVGQADTLAQLSLLAAREAGAVDGRQRPRCRALTLMAGIRADRGDQGIGETADVLPGTEHSYLDEPQWTVVRLLGVGSHRVRVSRDPRDGSQISAMPGVQRERPAYLAYLQSASSFSLAAWPASVPVSGMSLSDTVGETLATSPRPSPFRPNGVPEALSLEEALQAGAPKSAVGRG
jgi:hypothetical protein